MPSAMTARRRRAVATLALWPLAACTTRDARRATRHAPRATRHAPRDMVRDTPHITPHVTPRPSATTGSDPAPLASPVDESAPALLDAIRHARATLPELLRRLRVPPPTQALITAKVRLVDGDDVEHIWLDGLRLDGALLAGALNDAPVVLRRVRRGDPVRVRPEEIVDWMAVDGGDLCGGYTVRLERRGLAAADRAALDRELGIVRVPTDSSACPPRR
jgi:uncharacterized protein YegJ (DUF2314 family)